MCKCATIFRDFFFLCFTSDCAHKQEVPQRTRYLHSRTQKLPQEVVFNQRHSWWMRARISCRSKQPKSPLLWQVHVHVDIQWQRAGAYIYVYTCICVCIYASICIYVCLRVSIRVHTYLRSMLAQCLDTSVHGYVCAFFQTIFFTSMDSA